MLHNLNFHEPTCSLPAASFAQSLVSNSPCVGHYSDILAVGDLSLAPPRFAVKRSWPTAFCSVCEGPCADSSGVNPHIFTFNPITLILDPPTATVDRANAHGPSNDY